MCLEVCGIHLDVRAMAIGFVSFARGAGNLAALDVIGKALRHAHATGRLDLAFGRRESATSSKRKQRTCHG